jgi:hypothetical protein
MSQRMHSTTSPGEAAVDGLLNGLLAGLAMLAFLLIAGLLTGSPTLQTLQSLGWEQGGTPLAGVFAHLAVASFYGLLWGLIWRWLHRHSTLPGWMLGTAYGILLFAMTQSLANTLPAPLQVLNSSLLLAAHCVYGVTLGSASR